MKKRSPEPIVVFISHISEEEPIAANLKNLIEVSFLGMVKVFVSSDDRCLQMGCDWLKTIEANLQSCVMEIVICSEVSVSRPWINFEAGAGWIRKIPVIPLCHSGMTPARLKDPLHPLQAALATDKNKLDAIFGQIAGQMNAQKPDADFGPFVETVKAFERNYVFRDRCIRALGLIHQIDRTIIGQLSAGESLEMFISTELMECLSGDIPFLKDNEICTIEPVTDKKPVNNTVVRGYRFSPLKKFQEILTDKQALDSIDSTPIKPEATNFQPK